MEKPVRERVKQGGNKRERGGSGRVKLDEVARLAGVSTATVSRAVNAPDKVSEHVRLKVMDAARQLNWIPNAAGRALASSRTHIAGAIIPTLDNEIFAHQVSGMQTVFAERGFTLFLGCSNYDPAEGFKQVQAMLARGVEAVAIVGENHPPELFDALTIRKVPYVLTYSYRKGCPHPSIGFDNQAAFETIVRHLLELGHRKFAAIFQPDTHNDRVKARLYGLRKALADAGLTLASDLLAIGSSTMEFGALSFTELMTRELSERPTAIVCGNDNIAIGALNAASRLGLRAPVDFSITGFDDLTISSQFRPHLTTMRVDNQLIGSLSANQLLSAIDLHCSVPRSIELLPEMKLRESSGFAPVT